MPFSDSQRLRVSGLLLARPWLLVVTLLLLHVGLLQDVTTPIGRGLLIGHLGAALLWQPLIRGDHRISAVELLVCVAVTTALGFWMSWGLTLIWSLLLAGMIGGKLFIYPAPRQRMPYWLGLSYLVLALVGIILPQLMPSYLRTDELLERVTLWVSPALLLAMLCFQTPRGNEAADRDMDFVGSLVIVLVLSGFLLGALALMFLQDASYLAALVQSLATMAAGLLLLGLAWNPRRSFAGLGLAVSRRVLSGGFPFDRWLSEVADLALREDSPQALVERAVHKIHAWPGVRGIGWQLADEEHAVPTQGLLGERSSHETALRHGSLSVVLYTGKPLGPTPLWQFDLMVRVLAEFYSAKLQAVRVMTMSYLQAVHETGARVTHEVKNLLQSLDTLCYALQEVPPERHADAMALASRQLPAISQRLHEALGRIRQPVNAEREGQYLSVWWQALKERHIGSGIDFTSSEPGDTRISSALFDAVAENLLRNALEKRGLNTSLRIKARVAEQGDGVVFTVEDDGEAIDAARAARLFHLPMESDNGFGIGLYQAARLASANGYALTLTENRQGCVRFTLRQHCEPQ